MHFLLCIYHVKMCTQKFVDQFNCLRTLKAGDGVQQSLLRRIISEEHHHIKLLELNVQPMMASFEAPHTLDVWNLVGLRAGLTKDRLVSSVKFLSGFVNFDLKDFSRVDKA